VSGGHVDVDPVLHRANLRGFCCRSLVEVHAVQVQEPRRLVNVDLVEGDVAGGDRIAQVGLASGQRGGDRCRSRLRDGRADPDLHDRLERGRRVRYRPPRPVVLHDQRAAGEPGEVDEHVSPFGGGQHEVVRSHGDVEEAALGTDLP
jgi:hypothetical protein